MNYLLLSLSVITLLLGPLLLYYGRRYQALMRFLDAFVLCSVFGLVAFHILPESIEEAGVWAALAAAVGLFGPMLLGPYLKTGECSIAAPVLSLASLGLLAHAMIDGAIISSASAHGSHGALLLALAVIFHRLPEGIGIWRVTTSQYSIRIASIVLLVLIAALLIGFLGGQQLLDNSPEKVLVLFQSVMAGMLLHVIFHHHHLGDVSDHVHHFEHSGEQCKHPELHKKWHKSTGFGAFCGIILVVALLLIHPKDHGHHHGHTGHDCHDLAHHHAHGD